MPELRLFSLIVPSIACKCRLVNRTVSFPHTFYGCDRIQTLRENEVQKYSKEMRVIGSESCRSIQKVDSFRMPSSHVSTTHPILENQDSGEKVLTLSKKSTGGRILAFASAILAHKAAMAYADSWIHIRTHHQIKIFL